MVYTQQKHKPGPEPLHSLLPFQSSTMIACTTKPRTATDSNAACEVEQNRGFDSREAGQAVPRALVQPPGPVLDEDRVDRPRGRSLVQRTGEKCAFVFEERAGSVCGMICMYALRFSK